MVATWRMATALLPDQGTGAFIVGRDRFARDVLSRPDAAGVYALVECADLFDGVELPCLIAFFVLAENVEEAREGGPLKLSAKRSELTGQRQPQDLALKGNKISVRPSPFARLALEQRRGREGSRG